jgi:hypothetical protein
MISALRLRNFKSFGDTTQRIELRPLTLVFGPNSAGKSSVIQSLLLLKQSHRRANTPGTAGLLAHGEFVDVGSFRNAVHKHGVSRKMELGIDTRRSVPISPSPNPWVLTRFPQTGVHFAFVSALAASGGNADGEHVLTQLGVTDSPLLSMDHRRELGEPSRFFLRSGSEGLLIKFARDLYPSALAAWNSPSYRAVRGGRKAVFEPEVQDDAVRRVYRRWLRGRLDGLISTAGYFPDTVLFDPLRARPVTETLINQCLLDFFRAPADDFEHSMMRLVHIGPFREQPPRTFIRPVVVPTNVGSAGENAAAILSADRSALRKTNRWLIDMDVPYKIHPEMFKPESKFAVPVIGGMGSLLLIDRRSRVAVSPRDVGFGVYQVIPILTQLAMEERNVVCIEQPEVHLHPRLQARLADIFIESTGADGITERSTQVIAETHSETMILRIQRRIREGTCDPSRVSIVYVDQDSNGGAQVRQLELGSRGEFLDGWPGGFFDESLADLLAGYE